MYIFSQGWVFFGLTKWRFFSSVSFAYVNKTAALLRSSNLELRREESPNTRPTPRLRPASSL